MDTNPIQRNNIRTLKRFFSPPAVPPAVSREKEQLMKSATFITRFGELCKRVFTSKTILELKVYRVHVLKLLQSVRYKTKQRFTTSTTLTSYTNTNTSTSTHSTTSNAFSTSSTSTSISPSLHIHHVYPIPNSTTYMPFTSTTSSTSNILYYTNY